MNRMMKLALATLIATPLFAQSPNIVVKVEKKANAQAQIDYARSIAWKVTAASSPEEKHAAVANASANLMAVERAWPNNRHAIIEANALLANLYVDGEMPRNAIETAERGLLLAPDDHRLHVAAGRSHARLGEKAAAVASYGKAVDTFQHGGRDMMENLKAMNDAASFLEKEKQHDKAAAALRHASSLQGLDPTVRVTLRVRALEQAALAPDRALAKSDLAQLRDAHRAALGTSLTPSQRALLNVAEKAIARFEGKF